MSRSREQTLATSYSRKVASVYWLMPYQKSTSPGSNISIRAEPSCSYLPNPLTFCRIAQNDGPTGSPSYFGAKARPARKLRENPSVIRAGMYRDVRARELLIRRSRVKCSGHPRLSEAAHRNPPRGCYTVVRGSPRTRAVVTGRALRAPD
jgi:hypothetical protein